MLVYDNRRYKQGMGRPGTLARPTRASWKFQPTVLVARRYVNLRQAGTRTVHAQLLGPAKAILKQVNNFTLVVVATAVDARGQQRAKPSVRKHRFRDVCQHGDGPCVARSKPPAPRQSSAQRPPGPRSLASQMGGHMGDYLQGHLAEAAWHALQRERAAAAAASPSPVIRHSPPAGPRQPTPVAAVALITEFVEYHRERDGGWRLDCQYELSVGPGEHRRLGKETHREADKPTTLSTELLGVVSDHGWRVTGHHLYEHTRREGLYIRTQAWSLVELHPGSASQAAAKRAAAEREAAKRAAAERAAEREAAKQAATERRAERERAEREAAEREAAERDTAGTVPGRAAHSTAGGSAARSAGRTGRTRHVFFVVVAIAVAAVGALVVEDRLSTQDTDGIAVPLTLPPLPQSLGLDGLQRTVFTRDGCEFYDEPAPPARFGCPNVSHFESGRVEVPDSAGPDIFRKLYPATDGVRCDARPGPDNPGLHRCWFNNGWVYLEASGEGQSQAATRLLALAEAVLASRPSPSISDKPDSLPDEVFP